MRSGLRRLAAVHKQEGPARITNGSVQYSRNALPIAISGIWLVVQVNDVWRQKRAVAMIERLSGTYEYDYQYAAMQNPAYFDR